MRTTSNVVRASGVLIFLAMGIPAHAQSYRVEPDPIFSDIEPRTVADNRDAGSSNVVTSYDSRPNASASEWSGVYFGLNSGWGSGTVSDPDIIGHLSPTGGVQGIQLGYNYQTGIVVLGLETDFDLAEFSKTEAGILTGTVFGLPAAGFFAVKSDLKSLGTLRARVGLDYDSTLFFVTAGMAYGEQDISAAGVATIGPFVIGDAGSSSQTHVGWTVGVGTEFLITRSVSLKAEYLYADLGSQTYFGGTFAETKISHTDNILRVGLNYKP